MYFIEVKLPELIIKIKKSNSHKIISSISGFGGIPLV